MRILAQAVIFTMRSFYGRLYSYINDTVTSLSYNFSITQYTRWHKCKRFFINIFRFEDGLDFK